MLIYVYFNDYFIISTEKYKSVPTPFRERSIKIEDQDIFSRIKNIFRQKNK